MNKDKTRVLVVADDLISMWTLQTVLEAQNYQVLVAQGGQTAIEFAASAEPDLIILDVTCLDDYKVCQRIREFSTVPIIMLSLLAQSADKVRGLGLGADDFIAKPFNSRLFLARVRAMLRRAEYVECRESMLDYEKELDLA